MGLVAKTTLSLELTNGQVSYFKSGPLNNALTQLTQLFCADILLQDTTLDEIVSTQSVSLVQQLLLWSDKEIDVKLILEGQTSLTTNPFKLMSGVPSLLSVKNIIGITISNTTGEMARVVISGAGV